MKSLPLVLIVVLAAAQIAVPVSMIHSKEKILRDGNVIRLKTRPIDPADPFKGRYVRLGYEHDFIPWREDQTPQLDRGQRIYATIETDWAGFAHFTGWSLEKPSDGLYLTTRYRGKDYRWNLDTKKSEYRGLRINMPFTRFYMDEAKAPRAEKLARTATRNKDCWVEARVLNGKAVIEDVFAEGQSLRVLVAKKEAE